MVGIDAREKPLARGRVLDLRKLDPSSDRDVHRPTSDVIVRPIGVVLTRERANHVPRRTSAFEVT